MLTEKLGEAPRDPAELMNEGSCSGRQVCDVEERASAGKGCIEDSHSQGEVSAGLRASEGRLAPWSGATAAGDVK